MLERGRMMIFKKQWNLLQSEFFLFFRGTSECFFCSSFFFFLIKFLSFLFSIRIVTLPTVYQKKYWESRKESLMKRLEK